MIFFQLLTVVLPYQSRKRVLKGCDELGHMDGRGHGDQEMDMVLIMIPL